MSGRYVPPGRGRVSDVQRLAEAFAKPGQLALLIDEDNRARTNERGEKTYCAISDALARGAAATVMPRDNIVVFDLDSDEIVAIGDKIIDSLPDYGAEYVLWETGSPGHRHLDVVLPVGGDAAAIGREIRDQFGISHFNVRYRKASRPPLWPHRLGLPVKLLSPATVDEAEAILQRDGADALSPKIARLLRYGDMDGEYETRSKMLMAIFAGMVNSGWPKARAIDQVLDPNNLGGEKAQELYRQRGHSQGMAELERKWSDAEKWVQENPTINPTRRFLNQLESYVQSYGDWPNARTRTTDHRMMLVLIDIAREANSLEIAPGQRRLMQRAAVANGRTVAKSLRRLEDDLGWITKVKAGAFESCTTYRINESDVITPSITGGCGYLDGALSTLSHDLFRHRGLRTAGAVWVRTPHDEWLTTKEIADIVGSTPRSVRDQMGKLVSLGLADQDRRRWRCLDADQCHLA